MSLDASNATTVPADGPLSTWLAAVAHWQGLPLDAVVHLHERLSGGRSMAQFSHPALGGLGQWMRGGSAMLPLGASDDLRRRVTGALAMLADLPPAALDAPAPAPTAAAARPVALSPVDGHPCCPHCGGGLLLPRARATEARAAYAGHVEGSDGRDDAVTHRPTAGVADTPGRPAAGPSAPAASEAPPMDTAVRGFWQSVIDATPPGAGPPESPAPVHGGVPPGREPPPASPPTSSNTPNTPTSAGPHSMEPMKPMAPMKPMEPMKPMAPMKPTEPTAPWWPESLGAASTTGGQNGTDYAVFPDKHRLAVKSGGRVTLYDTAGKAIHGAGQSQATGEKQGLTFATDGGDVSLADLKEVKDAG